MTASLAIVAPGMMTTVQDLGRTGYQRFGLPVSGALDPVALRTANVILGNAPDEAALEVAAQGPTIEVAAPSVRVVLAAGETVLEILEPSARRVPAQQSVRLERGQRFRVGPLTGTAIGYLAVEGGFDLKPLLGSRSTYVRAAIGGYQGRALRAGDNLALNRAEAPEREDVVLPARLPALPPRVRVVLGPQDDHFTAAGLKAFLGGEYQITHESDRMGMRLSGPAIEHRHGFDIVSDGTAPGSIQVPGTKLPIVLLADRQTSGGYPKIATVISADLPALGRLGPGAKIGFAAVTLAEAAAARRALEDWIAAVPKRLVPAAADAAVDDAALRSANLVSGVVNAYD